MRKWTATGAILVISVAGLACSESELSSTATFPPVVDSTAETTTEFLPPMSLSQSNQVKRWAEQFVRSSRHPVGYQIADVLMATPELDGREHRLLESLQVRLANEIGGTLTMELGEVEQLGRDRYAVTMVIAGTMQFEDLSVSAVDMAVPLHFIFDDSQQENREFRLLEHWEIDAEATTVTVQYPPLPTEYAQ